MVCTYADFDQHVPRDYDLLYTISCNENSHTGIHGGLAFRDAPVIRESSGSGKYPRTKYFTGELPVFDLQALMDNHTDGIAFVIIREVNCSEASVFRAVAGGPLQWTEAIYMKSRLLHEAMRTVATCYFQPQVAEEKPSRDKKSLLKRHQIDPADLFLFHHRALLHQYASEHPETSQHINALLAYAYERYGVEYAKAESLFARGVVDQEHIPYLFKPNDLIISGTHGQTAAFVLQDWPEISSDDSVSLRCWSFQADGSGFARRRDHLSILPITTKTITIQDLAAYPIRFATKDLQDLIRNRGQKHWAHRIATQITYKGWNVARDQFYVSLGLTSFI